MTRFNLAAAVSNAFNFVAKQTGIEQTDREILACERGIKLFTGESSAHGNHFTATRDKVDANAMAITYRNPASVNDGMVTVVFLSEDNVITWEN